MILINVATGEPSLIKCKMLDCAKSECRLKYREKGCRHYTKRGTKIEDSEVGIKKF